MTKQISILAAFTLLGVVACQTSDLPVGREMKLELPETPDAYQVGVADPIPTLGRVLFYDRRLSINNTVSCSSCHKQELAFADNVAFSVGYESRLTKRNSMPIQNLNNGRIIGFDMIGPGSGFGTHLFWDGRENSLETMVLRPIVNHVEMGITDLDALAKKLSEVPYYQDLFTKAYGTKEVNPNKISDALSWFLRSIRSNQTRLDAFQNTGEGLTVNELVGRQLFMEKYDCNSCHQVQQPNGYIFGGTFANIGLEMEYTDSGLEAVTNSTSDAGKFKIPSLRNVALTAPYMHDGRFSSLDDVIEHYKEGIEDNPNLDLRLKGINNEPLRFAISDYEKKSIIAFLHTLTDQNMITDSKYSNPFKAK